MAWIIDAYNALFHSHLLPDAASDVGAKGLARLLHLAQLDHRGATIVADGSPKPNDRTESRTGSAQVIFSGPNSDADTIIEQLLQKHSAPRSLTVVSNDRRLIAAAKRRRANSMSSQAFMRMLGSALRRTERQHSRRQNLVNDVDAANPKYWLEQMSLDEPAHDPKQIDRETAKWMREFGYEPDIDPDQDQSANSDT